MPTALRILFVDDEPDLLESLSLYFSSAGRVIETASSGNEALKLCEKNEYDVVITDIRMANGDGLFLLESLKQRNQLSPIVVMMSGFSEVTKDEAVRKGAYDLIPKPLDFRKLTGYLDQFASQIEAR